MNLLEQENDLKESNGKKIVLILLISCVVLLLFLIIALYLLSGRKIQKELIVNINNSDLEKIDSGFYLVNNNTGYIMIKNAAEKLGYNVFSGSYKEYIEDSTYSKCYLQKEDQIIQMEANSNIIYKTTVNSYIDYEKYELKNNIIKKENIIYIALEDLPVALNVVYNYSETENKIYLKSVETLEEEYNKKISNKEASGIVSLSSSVANKKALAYNLLVVSNDNKKWGIVDNKFNVIIGNRYDSITYVEQGNMFIVSDNNKYGIIKAETNISPVIDLLYSNINVICNDPLCFEVKGGDKSLIANKEGKPVVLDNFDSIGIVSNSLIDQSVVVIKDLAIKNDSGKKETTGLVVCKQGKYGIIDLQEGKVVVDCTLDSIYRKTEDNVSKYYIQRLIKGQVKEQLLEEYIDELNTIKVDI